MNKLISILSLFIFFAACKKENDETSPLNPEVAKIKAILSDSLTEQEMNSIDWLKVKPFKKGITGKGWALSIESTSQNDFIYATLENGEIKFIRHQFSKSNDPSTFTGFNIRSNLSQTSKIVNWYSNNELQKSIQISNGVQNVLFENSSSNGRLITYSIPAYYLNGTYWLQFLPGQTGNIVDAISNMTLDNDPNSTSGVGGMLEFELDGSESQTPRDIEKIFKCFDQVPDGPNTTYKVKLCADVPVNGSPTAPNLLFSAGHAFLVITKSNGSITISQPFGFYPVNGPASLDLSPVANKIVIDSEHEINASLEMNCSKAQFDSMKAHSILLTNTKFYDLDNFNCANFALDVFNKARSSSNQIQVNALYATTPFTFPLGIVIWKSPQGIFEKLQLMKNANHPEANNIVIDQTRSTKSPFGTGECQ